MEPHFTTFGALLGLAIAILGVVKRYPASYSLIVGAIVGGFVGSRDLDATFAAAFAGASGMCPSALRILTSGALAGALVKTGAARKLGQTIVDRLGEGQAIAAIVISTCLLCAVGVFIDVAVITASPIALAISRRVGISRSVALFAMIGGGKAGNIVSPNPNTLVAAAAFDVDVSSLIARNLIPALFGIFATIFIASKFMKKFTDRVAEEGSQIGDASELPSLFASLIGPLTIVVLLSLRPLAKISIDPLIALPIGGVVCILATKNRARTVEYMEYGLSKVVWVAALIVAVGTISGVVKDSYLVGDAERLLAVLKLPTFALAPISGIFMAGAAASTVGGVSIASEAFAETLISSEVSPLASAATLHAGATVIDSLPHGSFFHATGGAVHMAFQDRVKILPYEIAIGCVLVATSTAIYGLFEW